MAIQCMTPHSPMTHLSPGDVNYRYGQVEDTRTLASPRPRPRSHPHPRPGSPFSTLLFTYNYYCLHFPPPPSTLSPCPLASLPSFPSHSTCYSTCVANWTGGRPVFVGSKYLCDFSLYHSLLFFAREFQLSSLFIYLSSILHFIFYFAGVEFAKLVDLTISQQSKVLQS